ncbi:hypothetical protein [Microbispora sp. H10885]|uniref:hypothetical protein n=1 Tax=Microbispora sp. H10885 TaxID=2729110 RepID=UPI0016049671|nr:hypothetical protein [Microbispora sp. H10885]
MPFNTAWWPSTHVPSSDLRQKQARECPRRMSMGSEAFYATVAQVLPTLLIALTIEVGLILRWYDRKLDELQPQVRFPYPITRETPQSEVQVWREWQRNERVQDRWVITEIAIAVVFLIGEILALVALGSHWRNAWTFFGSGTSIVLLCLAVVLIPLFRMNTEGKS